MGKDTEKEWKFIGLTRGEEVRIHAVLSILPASINICLLIPTWLLNT